MSQFYVIYLDTTTNLRIRGHIENFKVTFYDG